MMFFGGIAHDFIVAFLQKCEFAVLSGCVDTIFAVGFFHVFYVCFENECIYVCRIVRESNK